MTSEQSAMNGDCHMTDHEIIMSAPHPSGREVYCSCGKTFVAASGTAALLAQMDHRDAETSGD